MSSSTSSSEWRRFFRLAAGTAALAVVLVYAFVVLVDPFDTLPLSPPAHRVPVASNARFAFPSLARSSRFDSAVFGTSTSRLLRPAILNAAFGARFANLSMNAATAYEQSRLMAVFRAAHPAARFVLVGLDISYCGEGEADVKFTPRAFPEWLYSAGRWRGYREMFNLYAVQEAGQEFGILLGLKRQVYGSDGFTTFVPPDSEYDPARVAVHLRDGGSLAPSGAASGAPASWRFPSIDRLEADLAAFPTDTRKLLFFVPYSRWLMPPADSPGMALWHECKQRAAALARRVPNALAVDFMRPSPITDVDDNYWDGMHYRIGIADRIVNDLAAAARGEASADYMLLQPAAERSARVMNNGTAATRSATRAFSVGVCASPMSPGPSTTQGAIACNSEASVP